MPNANHPSPDAATTPARPTTVRLALDQLASLDEVATETRLPRSSLISIGVDALIDHFRRTGKLFISQKPKKKRPHA